MATFLNIFLIVLLIWNSIGELFSVAVFGIMRLGIELKQLKIAMPRMKNNNQVKRVLGMAWFMSVVRFVAPLIFVYYLLAQFHPVLYLIIIGFFTILEVLTAFRINLRVYADLSQVNRLNVPYLLIIFVCVLGYFG